MTSHDGTEQLLKHADWVRALAHRLVRDAATAEDVAQSAWMAALEAPPQDRGQLREWLGTVVRNLARRAGRGRVRREARELAAARTEALPPTDELVALTERQRELAAAVLELREPYRTTVLLRYYEGLSSEEIARRSDTPLNTVRTRLQRGLELLRTDLDGRYGKREVWCLAYLPLAKRGALAAPAVGSATLGVALMSSKLVLFGVGGLAVLALLFVFAAPEVQRPDPRAVLDGSPVPISRVQELTAGGASVPRQGAELVGKPDAKPVAANEAVLQRLRGRVLGLDLAPVAGLEIVWRQSSLRAKALTDGDGRFVVELPGADGEVELTDAAHAVLMQFPGSTEEGRIVVVGPGMTVRGQVVRESGEPVGDALVSWNCIEGSNEVNQLLLRYGNRFGASLLATKADQNGRFALSPTPILKGSSIVARSGGLVASAAMPAVSDTDLILVMRPYDGIGERVITGVVRTSDGQPAPEASVSFGQDSVRTSNDGTFRLALGQYRPEWVFSVARVGSTPHLDTTLAQQLREPGSRVEDLVVVLEPPQPSIEGHVVDADGKPCAGWLVDLADPSEWGSDSQTVEEVGAGNDAAPITGADGSFRLSGLSRRPYRVYALDLTSMLRLESDVVWPGARDVLLRVPRDPVIEIVVVQVVDTQGQPVPDALIQREIQTGTIGGTPVHRTHAAGKTDEAGRLTLRNVPRRGVAIGVRNRRWLRPATVMYDASVHGNALTVTVVRLRALTVRARSNPDYDNIQLVDAFGSVTEVELEFPGTLSRALRVPLESGEFPLVRHAADAVTIVVCKGERELRRVPIPAPVDGAATLDL